MKPDIFSYLDYRSFLKDSFEYLKEKRGKFSFRTFALEAGFTTPNLLKLVIKGERKLDRSKAESVAGVLGLKKKEREFFNALIGYDQSRTYREKNYWYRKILGERHYSSIKVMEKRQYEFFSDWHTPVVRELATSPGYKGDVKWIVRRIFPRVTAVQVEKSIQLLIDLHLIKWDEEKKKFIQCDSSISTPSEVASLAVSQYHKAVMGLGAEAIDRFDEKDRDIRSVTIGLPASATEEIKKRLESFWKEVMEYATQFDGEESVYQINLQFFPMTQNKKRK